MSIELLFPRSHVLENVIQTTNQEDHYRLVAVDSALEGLIKEWISNNYDLSPEELAKVLELGFTL